MGSWRSGICIVLLVLASVSPAWAVGWISPTGYEDPNGAWTTPNLVYDSNTTTYGSCSPSAGWAGPLVLTLSRTTQCSRANVFSDFGYSRVDAVRIEIRLQPSGVWSNVYEGVVTDGQWSEIPFTSSTIDAARFTYHYIQTDWIFWLYEFQLYEDPPLVNQPSCSTQPATSVEETSGTLQGYVSDDGGQPCQYRFQYGLTSVYSTSTPWTGSVTVSNAFSAVLTGLATNTVYHFCGQVQNSAGIASGSDMTFTSGPPATGWVAPKGWSDATGYWTNPVSAYDDNLSTVAQCVHMINDDVWGPWLYLTHPSMTCDKTRFYARGGNEVDDAQVDVYLNGVWTTTFLDTFPNQAWVEVTNTQGVVTQARIRFHVTSANYGLFWELYEFDFHRVVGVNISGACDGLTPVSLAVGGAYRGTYTGASPYNFSTSVGAGDRILVYYDGNDPASNEAAVATIATSTNLSGLDLISRTVVLRNDGASSLSAIDLAIATPSDSDIPYTIVNTNITMGANITLQIATNQTFDLAGQTLTMNGPFVNNGSFIHSGGSVIFASTSSVQGAGTTLFNNVTISGSLQAPTGTMAVAGAWTNIGTFLANTGTVTFSGNTLIGGTQTSVFNNVRIDGLLIAPSSFPLVVAGNFINNGTFSNNAGTVLFNGAGVIAGTNITTFNNVINSGTLTGNSNSLTVLGNWTNSGTYSHNTGTVVFAGGGTSTLSGATTFYQLSCSTPGKAMSFQAGRTQSVAGTLALVGSSSSRIVLRSTTSASKWAVSFPNSTQNVSYVDVQDSDALINTVTVSGGTNSGNNNANWIFLANRYWVGGAGVWSDTNHWSLGSGGASGASVPGGNELAVFDSNSGAGTCTVDRVVTVRGVLLNTGYAATLAQQGTNGITLGASGCDQRAGTFQGGTGPITIQGPFSLSGGTFISTTGTLSLAANFTQSGGTLSPNGGTTSIDGPVIMTGNSNSFNHLVITSSLTATNLSLTGNFQNNGTFSSAGGQVAFAGSTLVSGTSTTTFNRVSITGTLTASSNTVFVTGNWANTGSFSNNSGTVVFSGNTTVSGNSVSAFYNVTISGTLIAPGGLMRVSGAFINNGTFNHNGGTVLFDGSSTVGGASNTVFCTVSIAGTLNAYTGTMWIAGNWTNNGTFNNNGGSVVFNGNSVIGGVATSVFNQVTLWGNLTGAAGNMQVNGNFINYGSWSPNTGTVTFNGTTAIQGYSQVAFQNVVILGTLIAPSGTLYVAGDWTGTAGSFVHNGGVVVLNGTNHQTVATGGACNGTTNNWKNHWNELVVANTATNSIVYADGFEAAKLTDLTPSSVVYFAWNSSGSNVFKVTATNGLQLVGATNQNIKLRRWGGVAGSQWWIWPTATDSTWTVSYVDVADAVNLASQALYPTYSVDSGNTKNWFSPTLALIGGFQAYLQNGRVIVEWTTSSEEGTAGFDLFREGADQRINRSLIPGLFVSPQGGTYRVQDPGAAPGKTYRYKLREREVGGTRHWYGPFEVTVPPASAKVASGASASLTVDRQPRPVSAEKTARLSKGSIERNLAALQAARLQGNLAKILVRNEGLCYLSSTGLAAVLNLPLPYVQQMIMRGALALTSRGTAVTCLPDAAGAGFYFYGQQANSIYTLDNVYWLSYGTMSVLSAVSGKTGTIAPTQTFREQIHAEENLYAVPAILTDPETDIWMWDYVIAGDASAGLRSFTVGSPGAAPSGQAQLSVLLQGGTQTGTPGEHHATVRVNGSSVGEAKWQGLTACTVSVTFSQSLLRDGSNTIAVAGLLDSGAPYSVFYINSMNLSYDRYYRAVSNRLTFGAAGHPVLAVTGFTDPRVNIAEITDPVRPRFVSGIRIEPAGGSYRATFATLNKTARFTAWTTGDKPGPRSVLAARSTALTAPTNRANYLIITARELVPAAQALADYRRSRGLTPAVVDVESIYDAFNYGLASPWAIRTFVRYAHAYWALHPEYLAIVGEGTFDYCDYLGFGDNLVPPKIVSTPQGLYESDTWYGDLNDDSVPEMAVGRLPAVTTAEVSNMVNKIKAYESTGADAWKSRVILSADGPDDGGDFARDSDVVAQLFPARCSQDRIYLGNTPLDQARQNLLGDLNAGAVLMNYLGHGGLDRLAQEGLLTSSDVPSLNNGSRLPTLLAMTCIIGRFSVPGYDCLGELLLLKPDGGAIAVWSPTGLSQDNLARELDAGFLRARFGDGQTILGDAILSSVEDYVADGNAPYMLLIYNLLGDPALRLQ